MYETMKNLTVILLTVVLLACVITSATAETFECLGAVTGWVDLEDCTEYTVTIEDGSRLAFYADKNSYALGDLVYLTIWNATEQEVIDVNLITHMTWNELFRWLDRIYL